MSVKLVSVQEGKNIKLGEFYLGQLVRNHATNEDARIIGIDFDDCEYPYAVTYYDNCNHLLKDCGFNATILDDYSTTYSYDWACADDLEAKEYKVKPSKTPPITVQVSVQPTVQEVTLTTVKSHTPKRTKIERLKVNMVSCEFITIGNTIIAVDRISGDIGIAECHPDDTFNKELGMALAYWRTFSKDIK